MKMVTLRASGRDCKQYIAKIIGTDSQHGFAREFIGLLRDKGRLRIAVVTEPGLYVMCDVDDRGNKVERFLLLYDEMKERTIDLEAAMKIATLMSLDHKLEEAVRLVELEPVNPLLRYSDEEIFQECRRRYPRGEETA